jgi:GNAT superfamily N-acetyltransferase
VIVEGENSEVVADRFIAHAAEKHDWSYPEEALRNYARNWAEAGERLTGGTDRLPEIGDITIHQVTEDRIDDWLSFFDHDGFADNPDWASCYCLEPHDPAPPEMPERLWSDSRAAMAERLRTGRAFGYLAYVDGKPAGWVNASQRADYALDLLVDPDAADPSVVGVSCFVIAPPYRRHGVAGALLDRVIADASERGASAVEGYPRNDPVAEDGDGGNFRGPRSMYDTRGFEPAEVRERDTVVRRPVG